MTKSMMFGLKQLILDNDPAYKGSGTRRRSTSVPIAEDATSGLYLTPAMKPTFFSDNEYPYEGKLLQFRGKDLTCVVMRFLSTMSNLRK